MRRRDTRLWIRVLPLCGLAFLAAFGLGCGGPSGSSPTTAAPPTYPPGWQLWELPCGARAPMGGMVHNDQPLAAWYEKGFSGFPKGFDTSGAWSCKADSRTDNGTQFSTVRVQLARGGADAAVSDVIGDTFAMIARRSPDMKEMDSPGPTGGGYGQGKAYQGESARLFVRIGTTSSSMYIVIVRGDNNLDAANPYLRAFFDGFAPIAR